MTFHSVPFAIFLVIVFLLYWFAFRKSVKGQNLLLLSASYFFYGWWDYRFLSLILFSSVFDFFAAIYIDKAEKQSRRLFFLMLSLCMNLGLLFFFKYFNFIVESINQVYLFFDAPKNFPYKNIILPIGISFYTFQALSYTIDVYRRKLKATRDPLSYFVFVSFFPQIAAGPIERAIHLLPQFSSPRTFNVQEAKEGLRQLLWGVFKKVAIADLLATYVDIVYQQPENYTGLSAIFAAVFFAIQLYCDFSGYSDMAIGTAKLLGFKLSRNFSTPYFSKSMGEFWTRWHISLNTWFRDYVYIPLGGSKNGKFNRYRNVFIVFLISGLWHGASWKFVIWGAMHGFIIITELLTKNTFPGKLKQFASIHFYRLTRVFQMIKVFSLFGFLLIFFRANTFSDAMLVVQHLGKNLIHQLSSFANIKHEIVYLFLDVREFIVVIISIIIFIALEFTWRKEGMEKSIEKYPMVLRWSIYYLLIIWLCMFGEINDNSSFVYFQF